MNDNFNDANGINPNVIPSSRRKNFDIRPRKSRWWIPVSIILGIIGVCFIGFFVIVGSFIGMLGDNISFSSNYVPVEIKEKTILKLDFGSVSEVNRDDNNPFAFFNNEAPTPTFYDLIKGIKSAAKDDRIVGLYYEGDAYVNGAMAKELKLALLEFKSSGKFMYSYLESGSKSQYYLSLLSDSIFIPDEGMYEFGGFGISSMFMKGLYDKIGLQYEVVQCEDFKTAAESYKNYKFSDSAKAAYQPLLKQRENEFIEAVSSFRDIEKSKVIAIMGEGLITSDEMLEYKLADGMKTKKQVMKLMEERLNDTITKSKTDTIVMAITDDIFEDEHVVSIADYISSGMLCLSENNEAEGYVAVICGEGPIVTETVGNLFSTSEQQIVSSTFVELIEEAVKDDKVKGIIIRINSPGGSVIASEEIYQAIIAARVTKPVFASMGNVAASGGYYMAMACEKIICSPETITGSIGVVAAIPNFNGTLKKLDISFDTISTGLGNSFFLDPMMPLTQKDKDKFHKIINQTYTKFVTKAANARNMTFNELKVVAKGRVWIGEDAKMRKLVDTLGNLDVAISMMKDKLKNKSLGIQFKTRHKDAFNEIRKLFKRKMNLDMLEGIGMTDNMKEQMNYLNILSEISKKEKVYCALPQLIDIK